MNCENCKKEHDGVYGSGRFCSLGCSRVRHNVWTTEQKQRQSVKLKNSEKAKRVSELRRKSPQQPIQGICEKCGVEHNGKYASGRFCSSFCSHSFSTKKNRKKINKKISKTIKQKLLNGEQVGFAKIDFNIVRFKPCVICGKETPYKKKCCSIECSDKLRIITYSKNKLNHKNSTSKKNSN